MNIVAHCLVNFICLMLMGGKMLCFYQQLKSRLAKSFLAHYVKCVEPGRPSTSGGGSICCHLALRHRKFGNSVVFIGLVLKLISMLRYCVISKAQRFGEYCIKPMPVSMLFPFCVVLKVCFRGMNFGFLFC